MNFISKFNKTHEKRIFGLDILRSFAILLVVYGHGVYVLPKSYKFYYLLPFPYIDGVSVFFVLSGFLIGGILIKILQKNEFTFKVLFDFWIRRWFRTIPNYFFVLILLIAFQYLILNEKGEFNFSYFLFAQNLIHGSPSFFPESWSLSVEEWFYLSFPLLTFGLNIILKNKKKALLISLLFFLIMPLLLRTYCYYTTENHTAWSTNIQKVVIYRLDSLMYGVLGAYLFTYHIELWNKHKNLMFSFAILLVLMLSIYTRIRTKDYLFLSVYQYNIESIVTFLSLPYFSLLKFTRYKYLKFIFTFIAIISYSMYLLNLTFIQGVIMPKLLPILHLSQQGGFLSISIIYFLYWVLVITASYYLYKYFEFPLTKLRDKF
jgi:peptidoglycan/LPS O-acetylase OafA/YrhL